MGTITNFYFFTGKKVATRSEATPHHGFILQLGQSLYKKYMKKFNNNFYLVLLELEANYDSF